MRELFLFNLGKSLGSKVTIRTFCTDLDPFNRKEIPTPPTTEQLNIFIFSLFFIIIGQTKRSLKSWINEHKNF